MIAAKVAFLGYVQDLPPYVPGRPIESVAREYGLDPTRIIKLASNENPLGMSNRAQTAVRDAMNVAHRYPDSDNEQLKAALSRHLAMIPDRILPAAGSSELITLIARSLLRPGQNAVLSQYSFISYSLAVHAAGGIVKLVPARADLGHDLAHMADAVDDATRLVIVASPNNPTGTIVSKSDLRDFVDAIPAHILIVIDEAYRDFVDPEHGLDSELLLGYRENVLILRTFSKVHGLAGLRVGYGLGHPSVLEILRRLQTPFSLSSVAQAAATASLEDYAFVDASVRLNTAERDRLSMRLRKIGRRVIASQGNFVLVHVGNGSDIYKALLRRGVITRPVSSYGLSEWLRVSVGLPDENNEFCDAIADALVAA